MIDEGALKAELEGIGRRIPKFLRSERCLHGTLQCHLCRWFSDAGFQVVADYLPPRVHDRAIDVIALDAKQDIVYALCLDGLVTLPAVKSLMSFAAEHRIIFTTSPLVKKVQESRFFLKPEIVHWHLEIQ
jgi:hypothetical protein